MTLRVNGEAYEVSVAPWRTLLEVLREELALRGAKYACDGIGECGACTVLLDGRPVNSCLMLAVDAREREIVTIEGLVEKDGLHPLQEAFVRLGAIQCGYCTPGLILATKALLDRNPSPSRGEIEQAISGNLCRCMGYTQIVDAVLAAKSTERR
ncbi:MAG: (2Fe-2S)-binding protein [Candidatus Binatia bacterium]